MAQCSNPEAEHPGFPCNHPDPILISTARAGQRLGTGPAAVRSLVERGELAGVRVGRLLKIREDSVDALLERHATGPRP